MTQFHGNLKFFLVDSMTLVMGRQQKKNSYQIFLFVSDFFILCISKLLKFPKKKTQVLNVSSHMNISSKLFSLIFFIIHKANDSFNNF
jgi:hypothetical protein